MKNISFYDIYIYIIYIGERSDEASKYVLKSSLVA